MFGFTSPTPPPTQGADGPLGPDHTAQYDVAPYESRETGDWVRDTRESIADGFYYIADEARYHLRSPFVKFIGSALVMVLGIVAASSLFGLVTATWIGIRESNGPNTVVIEVVEMTPPPAMPPPSAQPIGPSEGESFSEWMGSGVGRTWAGFTSPDAKEFYGEVGDGVKGAAGDFSDGFSGSVEAERQQQQPVE